MDSAFVYQGKKFIPQPEQSTILWTSLYSVGFMCPGCGRIGGWRMRLKASRGQVPAAEGGMFYHGTCTHCPIEVAVVGRGVYFSEETGEEISPLVYARQAARFPPMPVMVEASEGYLVFKAGWREVIGLVNVLVRGGVVSEGKIIAQIILKFYGDDFRDVEHPEWIKYNYGPSNTLVVGIDVKKLVVLKPPSVNAAKTTSAVMNVLDTYALMPVLDGFSIADNPGPNSMLRAYFPNWVVPTVVQDDGFEELLAKTSGRSAAFLRRYYVKPD